MTELLLLKILLFCTKKLLVWGLILKYLNDKLLNFFCLYLCAI